MSRSASIKVPAYSRFTPSSDTASRVHARSSKKSNTRCEVLLRSHLFRLGLRFRKNLGHLPGKPDIVFPGPKVAVFCDGDFWHGRNWTDRKKRLQRGANPEYWVAKISRNMERDRLQTEALEAEGWKVVRVWEKDVLADPEQVARMIAEIVIARREPRS